MTKMNRFATTLTAVSLLGLSTALAQDEETPAEPQEEAQEAAQESQTEDAPSLTSPDVTAMTESTFSEADNDGDEALSLSEYDTFTRSFSATLNDEYAANLDTARELDTKTRVDVTSSAAIDELMKSDTSDFYDRAAASDKVSLAAQTRYAELGSGEAITVETLIADGARAFDEADSDGDDVIQQEELDRFASDFTGLEIAMSEAPEEETSETPGS